MTYFAFIQSRGGLTQPAFVSPIKAASLGEAYAVANKRADVKRFVGRQQTGDLFLRIYAAANVEAARLAARDQ